MTDTIRPLECLCLYQPLWRPIDLLWRPIDLLWRPIDLLWRPIDLLCAEIAARARP